MIGEEPATPRATIREASPMAPAIRRSLDLHRSAHDSVLSMLLGATSSVAPVDLTESSQEAMDAEEADGEPGGEDQSATEMTDEEQGLQDPPAAGQEAVEAAASGGQQVQRPTRRSTPRAKSSGRSKGQGKGKGSAKPATQARTQKVKKTPPATAAGRKRRSSTPSEQPEVTGKE